MTEERKPRQRKFQFYPQTDEAGKVDGVIVEEGTGIPSGINQNRYKWYREKVFITLAELEKINKVMK